MLRRLMILALAFTAFFALESCGVSRLAGPVASTGTEQKAPVLGKHDPVREPDPSGGSRTDDGEGEAGGSRSDGTTGRTGGPSRNDDGVGL